MMARRHRWWGVLAGCWSLAAGVILAQEASMMEIRPAEDGLEVRADGDLFTRLVTEGQPKPILYPVYGPGGVSMTRHYPMNEVPGEATDHVHHRSLWFAHGEVNGVDFWAEGPQKGTIEQESAEIVTAKGQTAALRTANRWVGPDGQLVCRDERLLRFGTDPRGGRFIDLRVTVQASAGDLTFGDTKEGTMAIRTHPNLRLSNDEKRGVTTANGHALNSEGQTGRDLWGKRAKWVDYWGEIEGRTVGVAIFDHPANPRHPTWWHARDYGLVAANPFGLRHFEGRPKGEGNLVVPAGESVTFTYRFLFHEGDAEAARIGERYQEFTEAWPAP